jgi:predicted TIM-barrel fold metal-dependent hydrolase
MPPSWSVRRPGWLLDPAGLVTDASYVARALLRGSQHPIRRTRFPIVDFHVHLRGPFAGTGSRLSAADLVHVLDTVGIERVVDLDGGFDDTLRQEVERWSAIPDRVIVFAGLRDETFAEVENSGEVEAERLRRSIAAGACGLKVWKTLGMTIRDRTGALVTIDDERLAPLWRAAEQLRIPVLIHVADPIAFFQPLDRRNERWDELRRHPEWHRPPGIQPSHGALLAAFQRVLGRHPGTTFVAAHLAALAHDLDGLASLLDCHPNLHVDISATINELGRRPAAARRFFEMYASRILFGSDVPLSVRGYLPILRFLETDDEDFSYSSARVPTQGRWRISGINLPDDVLQQVYAANATRLLDLA